MKIVFLSFLHSYTDSVIVMISNVKGLLKDLRYVKLTLHG